MKPIEITPKLLAKLREKAEKSIISDYNKYHKGDGRWYYDSRLSNVYSVETDDAIAYDTTDDDGAFIAVANPAVVLALIAEIERLRDQSAEMQSALEQAVADYGKPGGPWSVPHEPGAWITMAQNAIAKAKGVKSE